MYQKVPKCKPTSVTFLMIRRRCTRCTSGAARAEHGFWQSPSHTATSSQSAAPNHLVPHIAEPLPGQLPPFHPLILHHQASLRGVLDTSPCQVARFYTVRAKRNPGLFPARPAQSVASTLCQRANDALATLYRIEESSQQAPALVDLRAHCRATGPASASVVFIL